MTLEQQASLFRRTIRSPKTLLSRQRLAAEVQLLKKIPEEAHQREKRYRVFTGLSSSRLAESSHCSSGSDPHTLKADLVGIDGPREELLQHLAEESEGHSKQLKVISIVGIHGSGKTILAREVYDSDVGRQFGLRAWISATDRGPREVLMEILRKFGRTMVDNSCVDQLTVDLREHLDNKR